MVDINLCFESYGLFHNLDLIVSWGLNKIDQTLGYNPEAEGK